MVSNTELNELIEKKAKTDAGYAVAYAILQLTNAQHSLVNAVKFLGNGDAATRMGSIEAFGFHIGDKLDSIADALRREDN